MRVVALIQARMGSTRLPGKVLLDIAGRPALVHVVDRTRAIAGVDDVVVATSELVADDPIAELCEQLGWGCFRGSEEDVLDRYYRAATEWRADHVVRVTADCPLVCPVEAARVVSRQLEASADCTHNLTIFGSGMPLGTAVEVFSFAALEASWREGREPHHREHVDEFVYEQPERFRIELVPAPPRLRRPDYRLTVDTADDLELVRRIYEACSPRLDGLVALSDVVALLDERPDLLALNAHVRQKTI